MTSIRKVGGPAFPDVIAEQRAQEFRRWAMDSYGRVINYLSRYYQSYLDINLAPYGFSSAHFPLLAYLWEGHPGDTQNSIARILGVDKGTISRNIQTLVRLGLVVQSPCERDTRACVIELTEKGWSLSEPVTAVAKRWTEGITAGMDAEQTAAVLQVLQEMTARGEELVRDAQSARSVTSVGIETDAGAVELAQMAAKRS